MGKFVEKVVVIILKPALLAQRPNREVLIGLLILACFGAALVCSVGISILTVKVSAMTAQDNADFLVKANHQVFDVVPGDVLRIERTPVQKAFTGQDSEILKIYTTQGFIYAVPDDPYYAETQQLANAALRLNGDLDQAGSQVWMKQGNETTLDSLKQKGYAIGTQENKRPLLFALLGLQNFLLVGAGLGMLLLVFPFRMEKDAERSPVTTRVKQLA